MPRRSKPPGYEKWTWAEIDAGRRMSKEEKRWRRAGKALGREIVSSTESWSPPPHPSPLPSPHPTPGPVAAPGRPNDLVPIPILIRPSRPATAPLLTPFPLNVVRAIGRFLSFLWIYRLPDWLQPIIWPLVIGLALALAAARWWSETPWIADLAVCLGFVAAGTAIGGLIHDGLCLRRLRREQEKAERAEMCEQFRKVLARELSTRLVRDFDFAALVAQHAMPRFEADSAAAQVYRRFSDRVVEDGVITPDERHRMDKLTRMLEIGPERVAVIEEAAKSDRFHAAVDEVLADGVVTEDETRNLEAIRSSLGVSESDWSKAQDRIGATQFDPLPRGES